MSSRAGYRPTRYDVRTGERPAAVLRDPRQWQATRAAPRGPDDHRPQFRAVARPPRGEPEGVRGGNPRLPALPRPPPPRDDRSPPLWPPPPTSPTLSLPRT